MLVNINYLHPRGKNSFKRGKRKGEKSIRFQSFNTKAAYAIFFMLFRFFVTVTYSTVGVSFNSWRFISAVWKLSQLKNFRKIDLGLESSKLINIHYSRNNLLQRRWNRRYFALNSLRKVLFVGIAVMNILAGMRFRIRWDP